MPIILGKTYTHKLNPEQTGIAVRFQDEYGYQTSGKHIDEIVVLSTGNGKGNWDGTRKVWPGTVRYLNDASNFSEVEPKPVRKISFDKLSETEQDQLIGKYRADPNLMKIRDGVRSVYFRLHISSRQAYINRYFEITGEDLVLGDGVYEIPSGMNKNGGNIELSIKEDYWHLLPADVKPGVNKIVANNAYAWALIETGLRAGVQ